MTANTPLVAANVALSVPNGMVVAPTDYTIVSGDVTNGISIPASLFAGAISGLNFGQSGFISEHLRIIAKTTAPGTLFKLIVKATQPRTDIANQLPFSPAANAGDLTLDLSSNATRYIGVLSSGRFTQPDGSLLINFSGTLGTTTLAILLDPYAPVGPRG